MKTFNIYWCFSTSILIWFLLVHSPVFLIKRLRSVETSSLDLPFAIHLTGAYSISFACIINSLITPTAFGGKGKHWHVLIGRIGMIGGIVGFLMGAYCSWWPWRAHLPPLAFSIGTSIGGSFQIWFQYNGYKSIKMYQQLKLEISQKKAITTNNTSPEHMSEIQKLEQEKIFYLRNHIKNMIPLFVITCGAPAFIRLVAEFLPESGGTVVLILSVLFLSTVANFYVSWLLSRMFGEGSDYNHHEVNELLTGKEKTNSTKKIPENYRSID